MTYDKKLIAAKIFVSVGLCIYALLPLIMDDGVLYGNLMALPIMLWAVWGAKLHGTGRSVRLMAFLGMAYVLGFYVAAALRTQIGSELDDPGHEHLLMGIDANLVSTGLVFALLLAGVFVSIRRGA